MVKGQTTKKEAKDKGKQKQGKPIVGLSKRGRKSGKEVIENLFDAYSTGIPSQVRSLISGWE